MFGKKLKFYTAILSVTLLYLAPLPVLANPQGGTVSGGAATISGSGNKLDIHQSSNRAVIDWRSFDIAHGESVQFYQPSKQAVALNRVNSDSASHIDGQLTANGNILIVNQNGVLFGQGAVVDVNGLVASTAGITNQNFMQGRMVLDQPGNPDAHVSNAGSITAKQAGLVGLVAPNVENSGTITAKLGRVHLASGDTATVDLYGDGLMEVAVSDNVKSQIVSNTGTISASGGKIGLTAAAGKNIVNSLINVQGQVKADRVAQKGGEILIYAEGSHAVQGNVLANKDKKTGTSKVVVQANLSAAGKNKGQKGGKISVLADNVTIKSGSTLDASGAAGGGTIHVGGEYQGKGATPASVATTVEAGATVQANATDNGNGGEIIFWSDGVTNYQGHAEVKAGAFGGNGGLMEVSGLQHLNFDGTVDLSAPKGKAGSLLLDPTNITISTDANSHNTGTTPYQPDGDDVTSVLNITTLTNALTSGSVTVQTRSGGGQLGDITVAGAVTWTGSNTLTLTADHDIIINAAMSGRSLTLRADNDIQLNAAVAGTGTLTLRGKNNATTIGVGTDASGTLNLSDADLANITDGWSSIAIGNAAQTGAMEVKAHTWTDPVNFSTNTGIITISGAQAMGANNLTISTDADPVITGTLTGTANLTFLGSTSSTTIGVGDSSTGTLNLSEAELNKISSTWTTVVIGNINGTGDIDVRAHNWTDSVSFSTNTGVITINGAQDFGTTKNVTFQTNADVGINANLTGRATITFRSASGAATMGIGDSSVGTLNLSEAELNHIIDNWGTIAFGSSTQTGDIDVRAHTWTDAVTFATSTGVITFNGAQNFNANTVNIQTNADLTLNSTLSGTGALTITGTTGSTNIGLGDSATGTLLLSEAELNKISDGFSSLSFGTTSSSGTIDMRAHSWNDNVSASTQGAVVVMGNQNFNGNNFTMNTNSDPTFNATLASTGGTLSVLPISTAATMGLGDSSSGNINFTEAELNKISAGWGQLIFGSINLNGNMDVRAHTWNAPVSFRSGSGIITFNGAQNFGANNVTVQTSGDPAIAAALTGTGTLSFSAAVGGAFVIGDGALAFLNFSEAELNRITDGWASITFNSGNSSMDIRAHTWSDNVNFISNSGTITVNGAQAFGANNVTIQTNADPVISAALTGTGTLTLQPAGNITVGLGDSSTGVFNLSTAELNKITDGWGSVIFGSTTSTAAMDVQARTWTDNTTFQTGNGNITFNGIQNFDTNNATIATGGDPAFSFAFNGTGTLTIMSVATGKGIGVAGTGSSLALKIVDADLANITDGWSQIIFGSATSDAPITVTAHTWTDPVSFISNNGLITINGAQSFGTNDALIQSNVDFAINNTMSGTGNLTLRTGSASMGFGTGTGTVIADNTELGRLTFNSYTFGSSSTGDVNINTTNNFGTSAATFTSSNDVTLGGALVSSATGTAFTLSAAHNFINNVGSGAFNISGGGRWLVYSTNPVADTINSLASNFRRFSCVLGGSCPTLGTGNGFLYSYTPTLIATPTAINKAYGDAVSVSGYAYTVSGYLGSDASNDIVTGTLTGTTDYSVGSNVGTYYINYASGTLASAMGYNITTYANNASAIAVAAKQLTATITGTVNKTYDGDRAITLTGADFNLAGVLFSDDVSLNTVSSGEYDTKNAGTGKTVNATGLSLGGTKAGNYTLASTTASTNTASITAAQLNVTGVTAANKEYDGGTSATLNTGSAGLSGKVLGDTVNLSVGSGLFGDKNVADGKTVTASGFSISGDDALNYSLVQPTSLTANITAKQISITGVTAIGKEYDGGTVASLNTGSAALSGKVLGDTVNISMGSGAFNDKNVGSGKTVTASGFSISGDDALNYSLVQPTSLSATITAKALSITGILAGNKEYDGGTTATLDTTSAGLSGKVLGDDVTISAGSATGTFDTKNVGNGKTVTIAGITLGGDDVGNYDWSQPTGVTAKITAKELSITGVLANNKEYDGSASATLNTTSAALSGKILNDVVSLSVGSGTFADKNAADGKTVTATGFSISGGDALNYTLTQPTSLTANITAKDLIVTASGKTKTYGQSDPALTYTYTGLVSGDTSASFTGALARTGDDNVGNKNIGQGSLLATGNYTIASFADGTLLINPALLTVTANNATKEYGDSNPGFSASVTGLVNGDNAAVFSGYSVGSSATNASGVGSYAVAVTGGSASNYTINRVNGTLTVTPAQLTIAASNASRTEGQANPTFGASYSGFKNSDTESVISGLLLSSSAGLGAAAGNYNIVPHAAMAANYNIHYVNGVLTVISDGIPNPPTTVVDLPSTVSRVAQPIPVIDFSSNVAPSFTAATLIAFAKTSDAPAVAVAAPASTSSAVYSTTTTDGGASYSNDDNASSPSTDFGKPEKKDENDTATP